MKGKPRLLHRTPVDSVKCVNLTLLKYTESKLNISQALITQLLTKQWGFSGYVRWLRGLRNEYTLRRNDFIDAFAANFDMQQVYVVQGPSAGCTALVASNKSKRKYSVDEKAAGGETKTLFSFVPPSAGMFIWVCPSTPLGCFQDNKFSLASHSFREPSPLHRLPRWILRSIHTRGEGQAGDRAFRTHCRCGGPVRTWLVFRSHRRHSEGERGTSENFLQLC